MKKNTLTTAALALTLFLLAMGSASARTPLSSTVGLFSEVHFKNCEREIQQIKDLGSPGVNFVVNQYVKLTDDYTVRSYCYSRANGNCELLSSEVIREFEDQLTTCFKKANSLGLEISILPHIDDLTLKQWRNRIRFNPKTRHEGVSYYEGFLLPIRNALLATRPRKRAYFSLQGEMGATIFENPGEYIEIYRSLKADLHSVAKVGLSLNFNYLNGVDELKGEGKDSELGLVQRLFEEVDFVGISVYKAMSADLNPSEFDGVVSDFIIKLRAAAVELPREKEFLFSEVGLGGGSRTNDGRSIAASYEEALSAPYAGVHSSRYREDADPWKKEFNHRARTDYYASLLRYLGGKKEFNVSRAYLWNVASWDFQGLFNGAESYRDPALMKKVKTYNTLVLHLP